MHAGLGDDLLDPAFEGFGRAVGIFGVVQDGDPDQPAAGLALQIPEGFRPQVRGFQVIAQQVVPVQADQGSTGEAGL